ncbi:MAG: hypothetical protein U0637_04120 [Phycisphaerales bacterium]
MIVGSHVIISSTDPAATRAFLGKVLGAVGVDAGRGWLIFALPPGEVAAHPAEEGGGHELYLMCDDIDATVDALARRGVEFAGPVSDRGWGRVTSMHVPGAGTMGLYQPLHPVAAALGVRGKGKAAGVKATRAARKKTGRPGRRVR